MFMSTTDDGRATAGPARPGDVGRRVAHRREQLGPDPDQADRDHRPPHPHPPTGRPPEHRVLTPLRDNAREVKPCKQ